MRQARLVTLLLGCGLLVVGCSEQPEPAAPDVVPSLGKKPNTGTILSQIAELFPPPQKQEAQGLFRDLRCVELIAFTREQQLEGNLRDPKRNRPPTIAEAVIQLTEELFAFEDCGLGDAPDGFEEFFDPDFGVVAELTSDADDFGPEKRISNFRAFDGTIPENGSVLLLGRAGRQGVAKECPAVFDTELDCYGPPYEWLVVPTNSPFFFDEEALPLVTVCHVLSGAFDHLGGIADLLQLGQENDPFVILDKEEGNVPLECQFAVELVGPPPAAPQVAKALDRLYEPLARLAERVFGPRSLHAAAGAVHARGISGRPKSLASFFAAIHPATIEGNVCVQNEGCVDVDGAVIELTGDKEDEAVTVDGNYRFTGLRDEEHVVTLTEVPEGFEGVEFMATNEDCEPSEASPSATCDITGSDVLTVNFEGEEEEEELPDLSVVDIEIVEDEYEGGVSGTAIIALVDIENTGMVTAEGPFDIHVQIFETFYSDVVCDGTVSVPSLEGESDPVEFEVPLMAYGEYACVLSSGFYEAFAEVDPPDEAFPNGQVDESDENNNTRGPAEEGFSLPFIG